MSNIQITGWHFRPKTIYVRNRSQSGHHLCLGFNGKLPLNLSFGNSLGVKSFCGRQHLIHFMPALKLKCFRPLGPVGPVCLGKTGNDNEVLFFSITIDDGVYFFFSLLKIWMLCIY